MQWWLPLCSAISSLVVLAAIGWLFWRARQRQRQLGPDTQATTALQRIAGVFAVLALLWLGYGLYFMYQHFDPADALLLFARQGELLRQPLIIGGIAWAGALLVARLLGTVRTS